MSVTAVPLSPIQGRVVGGLWLGLAFLALLGIGFALFSVGRVVPSATAFLARNANKPDVVVTASGLQYKVERLGTGPRPTVHDIVAINYTGRLTDGTVFDSTDREGRPVPMPVTGIIPGFSEGLRLMPVGSKFRFWIPPNLGYGAAGAGNGVIPPNAVLDFEVELLAVAPQAAMQQQGMSPPPNGAAPEAMAPQMSEPPAGVPEQAPEPPSGVTVHSGEPPADGANAQ